MMSDRAVEKMQTTAETSFSMSLKRWSAIMDTYEAGGMFFSAGPYSCHRQLTNPNHVLAIRLGFGYHTTMPTDGLRDFHEISVETLEFGLPELKAAQLKLGKQARAALDSRGLVSVAAPGFEAPGVLVYYSPTATDNPVMMNKFKGQGLQIAMGGK